jgi:hypothetical protein
VSSTPWPLGTAGVPDDCEDPPLLPWHGVATIRCADAGTVNTFATLAPEPPEPPLADGALLPGRGAGVPGARTSSAPELEPPDDPPEPPEDDPLEPPDDPPEEDPPEPPEEPLLAQPGTSTTRRPLSAGSTTLVPPFAPLLDPVQGSATTIRSAPAVGTSTARIPALELELPRVTVAHAAHATAPASRTQIRGEALSTRRPPSDTPRSSPSLLDFSLRD